MVEGCPARPAGIRLVSRVKLGIFVGKETKSISRVFLRRWGLGFVVLDLEEGSEAMRGGCQST